MMTLSDAAELTLLSWDTIKHVVKARLIRDYQKPRLKEGWRLAIDEIHPGRIMKFCSLVMDLDDGRILGPPRAGGSTPCGGCA